MSEAVKSKRIEWIDSLRGLIMFLVVLIHVENFGFGGGNIMGMGPFFAMFRMPVFMFVSGFLAYKVKQQFDISTVKEVLTKKLRVLIFPTLFFGLIFSVSIFAQKNGFTAKESIVLFFLNASKFGYWFTWVLFLMFSTYYLVSFLLRKCRLYVRQIVLAGVAFACYIMSLLGADFYQNFEIANFLCLFNFLQYFQFFIFGTIFSCYREVMFDWFDKKYVVTSVLVLFVLCYVIRNQVNETALRTDMVKLASKGFLEVGRFSGILAFIALFRRYSDFFSQKTAVGRFLQYTGRHTLDVYMLHFFFIPNLVVVGEFFRDTPNFVLELALSVGFSVAIVVFCFIVSSVIRISPVLSYLFLGEKKNF